MFKRTLLILLSVAIIFSAATGCGIQNEESVLVKESSDADDFSLEETTLLKPVEFLKSGIGVTLNNIIFEDFIAAFSFSLKNDNAKPFKIIVTDLSINGIMYQGFLEDVIDPKTSKDSRFEISNEWFSASAIKVIKEIEYTVRILDEESTEIASSDVLRAVTNAPEDYIQEYKKSGSPVFENDAVVILSLGIHKSKYSDDSELSLYIENKTGSHFSVIENEVYVNEKLFTPTFIVSVGANKKATESILITKQELLDANIEEITSVKASFEAIDKKSNTVFKTELIDIPVG